MEPVLATLLTETQTANVLGVSKKTLQNWRVKGFGPRFVKLEGKIVRYRQCDIDNFVSGSVVSSTSQITEG